jgi:hypothetical protein
LEKGKRDPEGERVEEEGRETMGLTPTERGGNFYGRV